MRILYKYCPPDPNKHIPIALRTQTLLASDPHNFNDPFEVRPWFDQERHNYYSGMRESQNELLTGNKHSLIKGHSMTEIAVENASSFGDTLNEKFRNVIGKRFRVLCFSENPKSPLMWGHYTKIYQGAVIGVDVDDPGFEKGLRAEGFKIDYTDDRSGTRLPIAFYQSPAVESYWINGEIANDPMEPVFNEGKYIRFHEYRRMLEEAYLKVLSTKAKGWGYEEEIRFIYDLTLHKEHLASFGERSLVAIPLVQLKKSSQALKLRFQWLKGLFDYTERGNLGVLYSIIRRATQTVSK